MPSASIVNASVRIVLQEERDILLTADIGGTNCRFSLWAANIRVDVSYDEIFTKVPELESAHSEYILKSPT